MDAERSTWGLEVEVLRADRTTGPGSSQIRGCRFHETQLGPPGNAKDPYFAAADIITAARYNKCITYLIVVKSEIQWKNLKPQPPILWDPRVLSQRI